MAQRIVDLLTMKERGNMHGLYIIYVIFQFSAPSTRWVVYSLSYALLLAPIDAALLLLETDRAADLEIAIPW